MKRKTFIKQAMAAGLKRNTAALAAQDAVLRGEPYYFALGRLLNYRAMLYNIAKKAIIEALMSGQQKAVITNTAIDIFYPWLSERPGDVSGGGGQ